MSLKRYSPVGLSAPIFLYSNGIVYKKDKEIVNNKDEEGQTLLHKAVVSGNVRLIEYLIKNGSDVNAKDNSGATVRLSVTDVFSRRCYSNEAEVD